MKIFISWSGTRSLKVAELLRGWINCVLQGAKPWVSSQNLDRGSLWFSEIGEQLKDTSVGIICLTAENKEKPWILFEAGALAKGLSASRVCPFLIDLQSAEVKDPLAQFNHTLPNRDSVFKLVETLNSVLGDAALHPMVLEKVFSTYWPQFEADFQEVLAAHPPTEATIPREPGDILSEILANTRALNSRISRIEASQPGADLFSNVPFHVDQAKLMRVLRKADLRALWIPSGQSESEDSDENRGDPDPT